MKFYRLVAGVTALLLCAASFCVQNFFRSTAKASDVSGMPDEYVTSAGWIWENRIQRENSVTAWDTIYDKIVAGGGTLNYVVRWQTDKKITLQQRQNLQTVLENAVNAWTDNLIGCDNWNFDHVNVKITGWAVLDESCLIDRQPDEVVYTNTVPYDPSYDIQNGMGDERIPTLMPEAPAELSRYEHWNNPDWDYSGSYENRYDMTLTATLGMIDMGGYGYYWGQQLSDDAVLGLADGTTSIHILEHEIGHGFGFTDFYGGEGEEDGFPPGGFPGDGTSIMMAGSSSVITDFDAYFAKYVWEKISTESGRFDFSNKNDSPQDEPVNLLGDVNADGEFSVADIVTMENWLLTVPESGLVNWQAGDFCADGKLDVFDLALMKRAFLGNPPEENPSDPDSDMITPADVPADYAEALEWIWQNRCVYEGSTVRRNTIFDQIYAGDGTLNFVVRWQSYKTITYEQRQQFEKLASDCVNAWNDWLRGYDGWKYDHIDVKIVGWAVLDKSCLLDLHDDEVVYDNIIEPYDSQYDTSNGFETIPDKLPSAPSELSRFEHFADSGYVYPGGLDSRFDMYLWATQGFPSIGGVGGDWGQRLSDDAYLNMLDGTNIHVLEHELGHGFGITDFYGENGANDGPPPNGFPDDGTSIMMAGSSAEIKPFDGWMLRYIWSMIKNDEGRF